MTGVESGNFYSEIPEALPEEITEVLAHNDNVRIERIISKGQSSEPGFWYDQEQNEWVVLIQGEAELRFEDNNQSVRLTTGMYVNIPARTRHRIEWTKQDEVTIWLAVFY